MILEDLVTCLRNTIKLFFWVNNNPNKNIGVYSLADRMKAKILFKIDLKEIYILLQVPIKFFKKYIIPIQNIRKFWHFSKIYGNLQLYR
jgi:hypothetical protein